MKKSIFLFFAAILCAIGMNAATVTSDGTARLYFNLKAVSWWNAGTNGNGNFAYFFDNSTGKNAWSAHAVKHSGDTYYVVIPNGTWAGVILTRNNTSTAPSWNNKWNQTGDIVLSSTSNYISKFSEGSTSVTWGTVKPASAASVSAAASTIFVGASTTLTSSLTSNTNLNTVKSATYSTTSGASISGNTFTASTAGTYTVTATVTYNPNGYPSITSTATATTTITVEELPTYTVTVNAGEGGTVTEGGIVTEGSSINITATPAENYEFNGWTITTGEGTFDNENAVSTTFSPTSDATIQANFRSTATYALKVIAGANIASAEGNVDPVTLGESYDITATPVVGYTFAGWTAEPTENATFATQESTTQVTVLNGSVNVTATATETMSALTTANSFDQDTPPAEVPTATATEIGIVTTAEVTATDVTGYTFVGWELTNCVSDDELTAKTIAVKSNGDGAAATVTAKYEIIKLTYTVIVPEGTEKCYIAGDMNTWTFTEMENQGNNVFTLTIIGATKEHGYKYACGNEWKYVEKTADGNEVSNRSYTANDKVLAWNDPLATNLYLRGGMNGWGTTDRFKKETEEAATAIVIVALKANTTYEFKVASADWSEGYSSTTAFTATSTQPLSTDVQDNAKLTTVAAGDYTFTWNLTTKKLTVTYPELPKYQVTATINPAETGTVTGIDEYEQGSTATLIATPADGYKFVNWTENEVEVSTAAEYTFEVLADHNLVANFEKLTYTVTATAENGTVTGDGTYEHGATATLTATANDHYVFVNWTKGEEVVAETAEYTFTVEEDVELTANFARDTHTVNATAENGTVTGSGEYTHGAEITLTATPAFDYQFVNWTKGEEVVSTDNPLTITVAEDVTLKAVFAEVAPTEVKESGVFSISAHKTATFATGNLQYNVGTETWRFAKQQYQVVGEQNIQLGHPDFAGWIDMLGYSADGKYGVNPSNKNEDYAGEFVDWGTLFPEEGWSTLSKEDWKYLLEERTNAANLQQVAKVGDILGIMLFPDNWTLPKDCNPTPEINHDPDDGEETKYDFTTQNYTLEQWTKLEQDGAVFLPAAGRRTGGWGNTTLSENVPGGVLDADGHYKHFDNCNEYAYYWTSTKVGENVNYLINCRLVDKPNDIYSVGAAHVDWAEKGRYGQSVRLAKVVYDKHTVTATAENGTVTGADADEYTHGTEITLTAIPEEHYVFVNWTAGETVLSTENPYIFTLEKDIELTANFALDTHTVTATAENGTVTGDGIYEHGATATLTAMATDGYEFVNWTVGEKVVAETAEYTFTVEADVNLVANFKKQIVHTAITAEDAIVCLIDGVLYFNGVLEDGTPYQVTLNEYTEVGDYTNISWTTYGEDEVEVVGAQANVTDEEGKLTLTATVTNETNSYGLTISGILPAAEEDVKEVESLVYTLTPANGSNNGYASNCDITINDITWNLTGNSTVQPWRLGGKSITKVDRALYSKTPLAYNISKIEVTHGEASSIVNSFKLIISDEANGAGETIDVAFKAGVTTTIDLPEGDYTNKYFKFVYNVTVTGNSNKFIEFTGAKFYATITTEANPAPEAPAFTGEANFVGSTEVKLNTTEENINIYYTLTDDYTLPTAGYMYAEPIELTETTTVKAIAHNTLTGKISEIAEKTFTKAELYTIKWSVNGEGSETTKVVQGNTLVLPADPTAPEACGSKVFMGWATTSSVNTNGTDITYVDNTTIPTGDAIYYAVFAKTSISDSSEDKEVTLSIKEYAAANGWVNSTKYTSVVVDENVTATVSNGQNTGKYYTNGYEWRIYQSDKATLTIAAKEGCMLKAINVTYNVSNDGTLLDAPSGKKVEVEAESVTFKVGNTKTATNGQVKITAMTITYNAGETYTYSEYSTTCSGTGTDVENIEVKGKSVKMIVNGQLIIIKNGVTYNAQGQVVK